MQPGDANFINTMNTQIILAIDFDGTIAEHSWPELGAIRPGAAEYINKLYEEGYYIIIWTCREGEHLDWIADYLNNHKINYHLINEHNRDVFNFYKNDTRKIFADIYIDDKQLSGLPAHWSDTYQLIKKHSEDIVPELSKPQYNDYRY